MLISALFVSFQPNDLDQGGDEITRNALVASSDWIRVRVSPCYA